jgi:leucyl aminopeptidase
MTPTRLAAEAQRIGTDNNLSVKILHPAQVEKLGMGALLGVAKGAKEPLRLIVLKYTAAKSKKTIGLIGKGITFDSGGLSLKTAVGMEHMKYDMAGAAAVLAAMQVIGQLKPNVSVLAVIASTENMPGSNALHPGDVLKSMNGKTIEVNNTDAEGRLILADAITYALREGVDELIDIATLTGAVVSALGRVAAGIMGSDQTLVDNVIASGKLCGEQFWQLPLFVEYKEGLKSDIADLKNAGSRGEAGSSSAAMFLKEFAEGKPWAHLDIAGVGWTERERDEICKGGTGFGARTLSNYVLSQGR